MEIFIDESGSFVCSKNPDSWCVVAAYVISGNQKNAMQKLLTQLKIKSGKKYNDEIKLKNVKEKVKNHQDFLRKVWPQSSSH